MKKWICLLLVAVLMFALAIPASAASYSPKTPKWVTIDGKISKNEWGTPIYQSITLNEALRDNIDDQLTAWWFDHTGNKKAYFDLYVNHNDENINIACVIHNVDRETSTDAAIWQQMNFTFTVAKYDEETTVPVMPYKGKMYEHYTGYRIIQQADGVLKAQTMTLGMTARSLYANVDYAALYDPTARTMTYEVALPFAYTEIKPETHDQFCFSAVIAMDQYSNTVSGTVDGSNRWLIGTAAARCGGAENFAHDGHCIQIKMIDPKKVEKAKPKVESPKATATIMPQDLDTDLEVVGKFEAPENVSERWTIVIASAAVVLACVAVIVVVLILDKKKKTPPEHAGEEVKE